VKSIKLNLALVLFSFLVTTSAMAVTIPQISGYVLYANSYNGYVYGASVKICTTPDGTGSCIAPTTNAQGYYQYSNWGVGDNARLYFFPYTDSPQGGRTGRWGSSSIPIHSSNACQSRDQFGNCKNFGISYSASLYPSPLTPVAVNPAPNSTNVGLVQTMKWTSSSDSWRTYTNIVYDIYASGFAAPLLLQTSGLPCNPDASGRCQWVLPVTLDPQVPYNWKIVARAQNAYGFTTQSLVYHFTTGY